MKRKFLVLCIMFVMGVTLTGCTIASEADVAAVQDDVDAINVYDDKEIRDQLVIIEAALASRVYDDEPVLDDLELLDRTIKLLAGDVFSQLSDAEDLIVDLTTELETAQADIADLESQIANLTAANGNDEVNHDYIYDENGDYLSGYAVFVLLLDKYFGLEYYGSNNCSYICVNIGNDITFDYEAIGTLEINDLFAKYILMFEELKMYEYYYEHRDSIGMGFYNEIDVDDYQYFYFNINITTLLNDDFDLNVHALYNFMYGIRGELYSSTLSETAVQAAYDAYVTAGTYDGFVLDFE